MSENLGTLQYTEKDGRFDPSVKIKNILVLLLLDILVNSYGRVGRVDSGFVGLIPAIEMNDTSSPALS